jgi:predicted outer membrane repeat protein
MLRHLLLLTFLACSLSSKAQTVLYVDSSVASSSFGTTWPTAYKTLNEALVVANAGTSSSYIINIAKGTYYPTRLQSGTNRDSAYFIKRDGLELYGGFPTGGGTRNVSANPTILNGNISSATSAADNSHHIMVVAGVTGSDSIVLDGLAFINGRAMTGATVSINGQSVSSNRGGALYSVAVAATLYINNCYFTLDSASTLGGAIYSEATNPVINSSTFASNFATDGGAIWSDITSANRLIACKFNGNRASRNGGAVFSDRFNTGRIPEYTRCTFTSNTAAQFGGAIYESSNRSAPAHFNFSTFTSNSAVAGGAISLASDSTLPAQSSSIKGCIFNANTSTLNGGAISAYYTRINYEIDSSSFSSNRSNGQGGAVYVTTSGTNTLGTISNTTFAQDSAILGGAVYNDAGHLTINRSRFERNVALNGGAVYNFLTTRSPISNSVFAGNQAVATGGAILNFSTDSISSITNCLITGNRAGLRGGGIYDSAAKVSIYNSTIAGNAAPFGNGIANLSNTTLHVGNSIVWEGATNNIFTIGTNTTVSNSIVQSGFTGLNNLTADPLFVSPLPSSAAPTTSGDYHLLGCSPAINSGNNNSVTTTTDLDGNVRIYDTVVDRGAYEYPIDYPSAITGDTSLCAGNLISLGNYTAGGTWISSATAVATVNASGQLTGVAPGTTTITYTITNACPVTITKTIHVDTVNSTVTLSGSTLTSNQSGANYQWLNCLSGMSPVSGQTSQSFTPSATGQYAVAVSRNGCTDTSTCFTVIGVGVKSTNSLAASLILFPNPASNTLNIQTISQTLTRIRLADLTGKTLLQAIPTSPTTILNLAGYVAGLYLLEVSNGTEKYTARISIVH